MTAEPTRFDPLADELAAATAAVLDARLTLAYAEARAQRAYLATLVAHREPHPAAEAAPPLLTVTQAAEWLGVSETLVRQLVAVHKLAVVRIGRTVHFRVCDLEAFTAAERRPSREEAATERPARPTAIDPKRSARPQG